MGTHSCVRTASSTCYLACCYSGPIRTANFRLRSGVLCRWVYSAPTEKKKRGRRAAAADESQDLPLDPTVIFLHQAVHTASNPRTAIRLDAASVSVSAAPTSCRRVGYSQRGLNASLPVLVLDQLDSEHLVVGSTQRRSDRLRTALPILALLVTVGGVSYASLLCVAVQAGGPPIQETFRPRQRVLPLCNSRAKRISAVAKVSEPPGLECSLWMANDQTCCAAHAKPEHVVCHIHVCCRNVAWASWRG